MSYASTRSMNAELNEGLTDGLYKKVVRDRGGVVEHQPARQDLKDVWFGIHEAAVKVRPDGRSTLTPNYVPSSHPEPTV